MVHISLNPHPDDVLTDTELQDIAREYLEKIGYGNQPYLIFKHEDIDRHHLHIVTVNVDENGRSIDIKTFFTAAATVSARSWNRSTGCTLRNARTYGWRIRCAKWTLRQAT